MAEQASVSHPHRLKMDGSSDLICLNCLATVAAQHEADQSQLQHEHVCPPAVSQRRSTLLQQSA
jgi:hypothetical protein